MPDRWQEARDRITGDSWADDLARMSLDAAKAKFEAYRCLVTASRTFTARSALYAALDEAEQRAWDLGYRLIVVVEGDAQGGDKMAGDWAELPSPLPGMGRAAERHPLTRADWYPGGKFDRPAGMKRNGLMVSRGAHECIAAVDECAKTTCMRPKPHGSHGASGCIEMARRAGIKVREVKGHG